MLIEIGYSCQDLAYVVILDMYLIIVQNFEYPYLFIAKSMLRKLNGLF